MKREHIPVKLVEEIAAELVTEVRRNLDGLVGNVKKRIPHLRAAGVSQVCQEVVKISNAIVDWFKLLIACGLDEFASHTGGAGPSC